MPEPGPNRLRVTFGYVAIVLIATAIGVACLWSLVPAVSGRTWLALIAIAPLTIAAGMLEVRVRVLGMTLRYTLSTVALLAALVTMPVPVAALGCALGVFVAELVMVHKPLLASINGAFVLLGMAVAGRIVTALDLPLKGSISSVAVLASVAVILWTIDNVQVWSIALARRGPSAAFRTSAIIAGVLDVACALLVGIGASLLSEDLWFIVPVLLLGVFALAAYRSYFRLQSDNDSFLRLHSSTKVTTRGAGTESERSLLLLQALDLVEAQEVQLFLAATSVESAFLARTDRDRQYVEAVGSDAVVATQSWNALTDSHAAVLHDGSIVVQLGGTDGPMGGLQLLPQFGHPFTETDRRLVEMFANHASVALQNEHLVDQLRYDLLHDRLTALPNRVMFDLQTRACLGRRLDDELVGVMLLDVDEFKEINDTLGHDAGDELLVELGRRITDAVADHPGAIAARLGGDEFAIVVPGCADDAELSAVAASIRAAVSAPLELHDVPVDVRASIGVAVAPRDSDSSAPLVQRADVSMYIAKRQHRGVVFYEKSDDPYSPRRLALGADLRGAVERGEIQAHFQPELDARTLKITGCEALARWTHPEHGNVFPDQFIPIAEQSGLIRDLTYHMLEQSLINIRRWRVLGHDLRVAVNLSVRCLNHPDIVDQVTTRIIRSGVSPDRVVLEVTEGTVMDNPEHAIAVLSELREFGVSLSIDDFGMGISSLSQIKRLPVQQVKVDREFVRNLINDHQDEAIVSSVVHLGHSLGLEVVAEGVEDLPTLERLTALGVDSIQGWLVAKAMHETDFTDFLRTFRPESVLAPQLTAQLG